MASNAELTDEQKLRKLKFARRGKKTSITSRVKQLEKLCEEQAKKRMITFLTGCLQTVFNELEQVCLELSNITLKMSIMILKKFVLKLKPVWPW